jgi:hypothetical protein
MAADRTIGIPSDAQPCYIGPRPFERGDSHLFFGREREIRELVSWVVVNRILLVYAPSCSGKTSLLNAGLIPALEGQGFEILPIARVRGLIPDDISLGATGNVYVLNTLIRLARAEDVPASLVQLRLAKFIETRPHLEDEDGFPAPRLLVFDQFEELLIAYPERWTERGRFFEQVREALDANELLRVVLIIREDYLAQLDPYAATSFPDRLRAQFRLEPMRQAAALSAVVKPLSQFGRTFEPGVAERLVNDLMAIRSKTATGTQIVQGEYVEPIQLQVVCQTLWSNLPSDVTSISHDQLSSFGDVNEALSGFYVHCIQMTVRLTGTREANIRRWFEHMLITPAGTRGTVYGGTMETGGLPNAAVGALENLHLIRAELRAGARWYELTHDCFIEPILRSNEAWQLEQERRQPFWRRLLRK